MDRECSYRGRRGILLTGFWYFVTRSVRRETANSRRNRSVKPRNARPGIVAALTIQSESKAREENIGLKEGAEQKESRWASGLQDRVRSTAARTAVQSKEEGSRTLHWQEDRS